MEVNKMYLDDLSYKIIGCAIEVDKYLGPGLLESVYEKCFKRELSVQLIQYQSQILIPIKYKGLALEAELRLDVLVENLILVELKAMDGLLPVHNAQILTYMRLMNKPKGILINFNCTNIFKEGQRTFVNKIYRDLK